MVVPLGKVTVIASWAEVGVRLVTRSILSSDKKWPVVPVSALARRVVGVSELPL